MVTAFILFLFIPGMCKQISKRLLIIIDIHSGHQVALDELPRLLVVVHIRLAVLQSGQGGVHGLFDWKADWSFAVLEVHAHTRASGLALVECQLYEGGLILDHSGVLWIANIQDWALSCPFTCITCYCFHYFYIKIPF